MVMRDQELAARWEDSGQYDDEVDRQVRRLYVYRQIAAGQCIGAKLKPTIRISPRY
jgi:hypothetical protein